jgi:shikimate kinase
MNDARHVVLVGLMGSGKTTVGRVLADRMGRPLIDNDEALERRAGESARQLATIEGSAALHDAETEVLLEALADSTPAVIGAAAATPLDARAQAALRAHDVVYLRADPAVLAGRVVGGTDDGHRPFLANDPEAVLQTQAVERDSAYRAVADVVIEASSGTPDALADQISAALGQR